MNFKCNFSAKQIIWMFVCQIGVVFMILQSWSTMDKFISYRATVAISKETSKGPLCQAPLAQAPLTPNAWIWCQCHNLKKNCTKYWKMWVLGVILLEYPKWSLKNMHFFTFFSYYWIRDPKYTFTLPWM